MAELFAEEQQPLVVTEDEVLEVELEVEEVESEPEGWSIDLKEELAADARRRLEDLLDERKLREELDDYFELEGFE